MPSERERFVVYEPADGEAGLAVSLKHDPGPHETKYVVEQLWTPIGDETRGRAEPVYVGDELRVASLIEKLSEALEVGLEVQVAQEAER